MSNTSCSLCHLGEHGHHNCPFAPYWMFTRTDPEILRLENKRTRLLQQVAEIDKQMQAKR